MRRTQHRAASLLLLLFSGGLLGLLLADTSAALLTGWRPVGTIERTGLALVGVACLGWAACCAVPPLRNRAVHLSRELLLLGLVCVFGWAAAELAAHHLEQRIHPDAPFHTRGAGLHLVFKPDPRYLPGIEGPSEYTTGPLGVRAPEPPGPQHARRLLCVGGSTTECTYLDDTEAWPARLMACLNATGDDARYWVGSVGISGFDTRDHLAFLRDSPLPEQLRIDTVVLQVGINDLWRYLASEEERIRYGRFEGPAPATAEPEKPESGLEVRAPVWTRSRLIQLYHTLRLEPPEAETVESVGGLEYGIRRRKRADAELVTRLPDLGRGLREYGERLRRIIEVCRARGLRPAFTTQPVLWAEGLPPAAAARCWFGWLEDGRYLALPQLRAAMEAYNAELRGVCEDLGAPCADLAFMHGNPDYFYDDCHFTEAGARVAAGRICETVPAE